jgi:hypothetical protein
MYLPKSKQCPKSKVKLLATLLRQKKKKKNHNVLNLSNKVRILHLLKGSRSLAEVGSFLGKTNRGLVFGEQY